MMITRSRSKRFHHLPVVLFLIAAALIVLFQGTIRREATRLLEALSRGTTSTDTPLYQAVLNQALMEENERFAALLSLPRDGILATGRVVARPPRTLYDTLLVAVDSGAGIQSGDQVYFHGLLLGHVTNVAITSGAGGSATVLLYSAPGATTEVRVGDPSAIVVMQGLGAGAFSFEVPSEVRVRAGDLVVDSSGGAVVAVVRSVVGEEGRAVIKIEASAPAAMTVLDFVDVRRPR